MTKIDVDLSQAYKKMSKSALYGGRRAVANQAMADMNQFVPMKEGNLRQASSIDLDGSAVNYHMKYASYQFYNQFQNYTTPGTGPRWDRKAQGMFMSDWEKAFIGGANW